MKKHLSLSFVLALLVAISFGCKVGADDPGLTFASRDGRIIATWKLTEVDNKSTDVSPFGTVTTVTTYNGSVITETQTPGGTSTTSYTLEITIGEDGALTATWTEDGDVTTINDYWEWGNADKNKSTVILNGSGSTAGGEWTVRRLTSKELVLERNTKVEFVTNGDVYSDEDLALLTFEAVD